MPKYIFIVNPKAGSGLAGRIWPQLAAALKTAQIDFTSHMTEYAGHAIDLSRSLARKLPQTTSNATVFVVVGGDGTVNQVLNGLRLAERPQIPIAYFPAGSGNDFARSLGLPKDISTFVHHLGEIQQATSLNIFNANIDAPDTPGYLQQKYLINNFGIGLDAFVVHLANHSPAKEKLNRWHLGSLAYLSNLWTVLRKRPVFKIKVSCNERTYHFDHACLVTLTNIAYFGGGVNIVPTADPHDTELDLIVVENHPFWQLFGLISMILTNGHHLKSDKVHLFKTQAITISCQPAQYGQMDGEDMGQHEFIIKAQNSHHPFWI